MKKDNRYLVKRTAIGGLLVAIMLILGYIESLLPLPTPVPGIKLGLSNGVLLFALYLLDIPFAILLMVLKVVLSSLMFSGINTLFYALGGGVLSLALMIPLSRMKDVSIIVVSMVGAVAHNAGQIIMAILIMHMNAAAAFRTLSLLMVIGLLTGAVTGVVAKTVIGRMNNIMK
ncbi:MAG: Gx transporter family protein [Clostridia bacterium]|nr:Gx transporter family protein [Clostridia bacterium]